MTEPGWYPDPHRGDQQRYWDGAVWTEHVHPYAAQPARSGRAGLVVMACLSVLVAAAVVTTVVVTRDDPTPTRLERSEDRSDESDEESTPLFGESGVTEDDRCRILQRTVRTAVEAWNGVTGAYPSSLDELTAGGENRFLEEPVDPDDWEYDPETGSLEYSERSDCGR